MCCFCRTHSAKELQLQHTKVHLFLSELQHLLRSTRWWWPQSLPMRPSPRSYWSNATSPNMCLYRVYIYAAYACCCWIVQTIAFYPKQMLGKNRWKKVIKQAASQVKSWKRNHLTKSQNSVTEQGVDHKTHLQTLLSSFARVSFLTLVNHVNGWSTRPSLQKRTIKVRPSPLYLLTWED